MVVFLIPVKSKAVSRSWSKVCSLLDATLRSVLNQNCDDFVVIVACSEYPISRITSDKIQYLICEDRTRGSDDGKLKRIDKSMKLREAYKEAQKYSPDYIMVVDSDDFIHKGIAGFLQGKIENGYYLENGYLYEHKTGLFLVDGLFSHICGTSLIVKNHLFLNCFSDDIYRHYQNRKIKSQIILPLPFVGAIYNRGHGENFLDMTISFGKPFKISHDLVNDFQFIEINK